MGVAPYRACAMHMKARGVVQLATQRLE